MALSFLDAPPSFNE